MRISFPWLDLRQYFSSVSSIWLVGRVGSNSLPHRPSSLPYCSAFSPGIRRADIRRTFSGYLSFPFVSSTTPNQKLYLSGGYPASGYLVRFLARPTITDLKCRLEAAATARPHPTKPPRQKQEEEELPPEPAIRKADIRRISKTSGMGFVNFAKHIITKIITFIEIIMALWYQTIKNNHKTLLLSFFSIFFLYNKK